MRTKSKDREEKVEWRERAREEIPREATIETIRKHNSSDLAESSSPTLPPFLFLLILLMLLMVTMLASLPLLLIPHHHLVILGKKEISPCVRTTMIRQKCSLLNLYLRQKCSLLNLYLRQNCSLLNLYLPEIYTRQSQVASYPGFFLVEESGNKSGYEAKSHVDYSIACFGHVTLKLHIWSCYLT